jgi:AcrR family transcriptional regulator
MRTKQRLTEEDWFLAGLRALAREGPSALQAESLARELKTTKGSFYWHFKDLLEYQKRLIGYWEERAFEGVIEQLNPSSTPRERLEHLCMLATGLRDPSYGGAAIEPALRAWALSSTDAAIAVTKMDSRRLAYLKLLCKESGIKSPQVPLTLYALAVGLEILDRKSSQATMKALLQKL